LDCIEVERPELRTAGTHTLPRRLTELSGFCTSPETYPLSIRFRPTARRHQTKMNRNATATRSSKRKAQGSPDQAPPLKRAVNGRPAVDDADYVEDGYEYEYDELEASEADLHPAMYIGTPGSLGEWQDT